MFFNLNTANVTSKGNTSLEYWEYSSNLCISDSVNDFRKLVGPDTYCRNGVGEFVFVRNVITLLFE